MEQKILMQTLAKSVEACALSRALFELLSADDKKRVQPMYIKHLNELYSELNSELDLKLDGLL